MANRGNTGNVYDLGELRQLVGDLGEVPPRQRAEILAQLAGARPGAGASAVVSGGPGHGGAEDSEGPLGPEGIGGAAVHDACDCPECDPEVLSFPPVALHDDARLAADVLSVPLVTDARRLAAWTGSREVTEERLLPLDEARAAVAELVLPVPADRLAAAASAADIPLLHLLWVVAVNTGLLQIVGGRVSPGAFTGSGGDAMTPHELLEFYDGVVMDVLDRADDSLTGSAVVDDHLAEMLATMYSVSEGLAEATLVKGILQSHEVACEAPPEEMRRLAAALPGELAEALELLSYCGLIEGHAEGMPRLTPLGLWAVRQDLLREGHDAPTVAEVAVFAELTARELVQAMLAGEAAPSAVAVWLERRRPEDAARELVAIGSSGTPGVRGMVGTILEELGPEAEAPVRAALDDPLMWRYAASWLHVRDLPAPALGPEDGDWLAVDTLAALLHASDGPEEMTVFEAVMQEDELARLVEEMPSVDHPQALAVLDLLAANHPDPAIAKAARKSAMRARSGALR
ncbi:hypothetical protein HNP84_001382 [Thermocatellispora tengchongensis]|uniref:Uncharacterized protein n=1 Tax=Thermocatellispora tengchongensis TaxID=1073253 RepID=A0A840NY17_9ACTN|nr:hypothetical protein [Thermocatellispora tengchongensis]MBB5131669.1 hypothetical protein [Thermocatellispora tengchongensis]